MKPNIDRMYSFVTWLIVAVLGLALLVATTIAVAKPLVRPQSSAGAPSVVSYQGKVTLAGVPYTGSSFFKFAVLDAAGTISYWSNDGSSSGGSQPASAIQLPVTNGLFTVLLGDTSLSGMTQALDSAVFSGTERNLRVWFSNDNVTFTLLSPDRRIASVPYALQAAEARNADQLDGLEGNAYQPRESTFYYPLLQAQSVDLAAIDSGLVGFVGGFSDGRYGFFVPYTINSGIYSGKVARLDLQNFSTGGVTFLDLADKDNGLRGFQGGFSDGRYGYLVPYYNGYTYSGKVARLDSQNFTLGGVTVLNLAAKDYELNGFMGGFTDGHYGYFVPHDNGSPSGKLARLDLQNFTVGGVTVLNLVEKDNGLKGFAGGFTDGRYAYLVPSYNGAYSGKVARLDLQNFTLGGVTVLDLAEVDSGLKGFYGGFTDGRYGYFVPNAIDSDIFSGKVARVDLQDFTPSGVSWIDLATVDSGLKGFTGGFTDGRYGYFVPCYNGSDLSGKVARLDLQNFAASGISWIDLATIDSELVGFIGGFSDGRYGYFVPHNFGVFTGTVARLPLFFGGGAP